MSTPMSTPAPAPTTPPRREQILAALSREAAGGFLLIAAAAIALAWANSAWGNGYLRLSATVVGPSALNLDLSLSTWAADGALAIFFFVVGLELKHELRVGALRDPRAAAVPVIAAVGGMVLPALVFVGVVLASGERGLLSGWAIPTATDIAFALAVLAIFGRGLPSALRIFLLTLAVVDDLLAVTIIALFYTDDLDLLWLGAALALVAAFALAARTRTARVWVLLPLSVLAWGAMHESGVHATIAGVLLGLVVPATARHGEPDSRVHWLEGINRPLSSALALPFFAFFAAGVPVVDLGAALTEPLAVAIVIGLIGGKIVGILGGAALASRLPGLRLDGGLTVGDLLPVSLLAAIGFTVSLLIAELSFADPATVDAAKVAVLTASVLAALSAAGLLRLAARRQEAQR